MELWALHRLLFFFFSNSVPLTTTTSLLLQTCGPFWGWGGLRGHKLGEATPCIGVGTPQCREVQYLFHGVPATPEQRRQPVVASLLGYTRT